MPSRKPPVPLRSRRSGTGKAAPARRPGRKQDASAQLHDLQNTIASIKLRLSVLAADPTCRWAQEENIAALLRISEEALTRTLTLRRTIGRSPRGPRRRRVQG